MKLTQRHINIGLILYVLLNLALIAVAVNAGFGT